MNEFVRRHLGIHSLHVTAFRVFNRYIYIYIHVHSGFIHFSRGIGLLARKRSLDRAKGKGNAKIGKKKK